MAYYHPAHDITPNCGDQPRLHIEQVAGGDAAHRLRDAAAAQAVILVLVSGIVDRKQAISPVPGADMRGVTIGMKSAGQLAIVGNQPKQEREIVHAPNSL